MKQAGLLFALLLFLTLVFAATSLTLIVLLQRNDTWADATAWFPFVYLIAMSLIASIGIPVFLVLSVLRLPNVACWLLAGAAVPAIGLAFTWQPYADHWYSFWPYWLSGTATGGVGWAIYRNPVFRFGTQ